MSVDQNNSVGVLANGVKILGETVLPGTSLLLDGNIKNGAAHAFVGLGARVLMGPVGFFLVAADSFSKSVSGKNLVDHASDFYEESRDACKARREAKAAAKAEKAAVVTEVIDSPQA